MKMKQLIKLAVVALAFPGVGFVRPTVHAQTCTAPPSGMVAWYPGDGNANDIQGGNDGTLQNGATFTAGKVAQAFHFNGVNQFVQTSNASNLNFDGTNSFSLDAWIRTSETTHDSFIASKQQHSFPFAGYILIIANGEVPACDVSNSVAPGAGQLLATLDGAVSNACPADHAIAIHGTTHLNDGQWHHVAMTYDGSSSAAGMKLYVDGAPETVLVQQDNLGSNSILNNVPFTIGSRENGGVPFNGDIDEVEVFNRALSASEIQAIYNAGSAGKCKPSQLLNISTRMRVQTGDNVLIGGFIITGVGPKRVILRGIGPSLSGQGLTGVLPDPTLELHGAVSINNDNWRDTQEAEIQATGIPPSNDLESAIVASLEPGAYTAILAGKENMTGIGLVEVYDLDQPAGSKLANISTRGFVETGDNVMIGGFITGPADTGATTVLIRAIGPSLGAVGIQDALQDPTLELHDGSGALIAMNDNWRDTQQAEIIATGIPPTDDRESAILQALAPGNYTAIVRGALDTTGVGLVEVYNLQ